MVVNRLVATAPRIKTEISGGLLQLTPSGHDPETTRKNAEAFVKELKTPDRH